MKIFFLSFLGILFAVGVVRLVYGLEPNSFTSIVNVFLALPPDIKSHLVIVTDSLSNLRSSLLQLSNLTFSGGNVFDILKSFFLSIWAVVTVPFSLLKFFGMVLLDVIAALKDVLLLLFGPVVDPIGV